MRLNPHKVRLNIEKLRKHRKLDFKNFMNFSNVEFNLSVVKSSSCDMPFSMIHDSNFFHSLIFSNLLLCTVADLTKL